MDDKPTGPVWNGRKIAKEEDKHDLESRAAVFEFKHRMARPDAEHRAHFEYQQDKHREAAAYHMQGLKASQGAGSLEEGHKHGMMYQLHMKALGLDPMGPVPHEIQGLADKQEKFYKFKPHRADNFLLGDSDQSVKKSELQKGWPKDEKENQENAAVHPIMEDALLEHGAQRAEVPDRNPAWEPSHFIPGIGYEKSVPFGTCDHCGVKPSTQRGVRAALCPECATNAEMGMATVQGIRAQQGTNSTVPSYADPGADEVVWHGLNQELNARKSELQKGWPKDEKENEQNAAVHPIMEDALLEHGAQRAEVPDRNPAWAPSHFRAGLGYRKDVQFGVCDACGKGPPDRNQLQNLCTDCGNKANAGWRAVDSVRLEQPQEVPNYVSPGQDEVVWHGLNQELNARKSELMVVKSLLKNLQKGDVKKSEADNHKCATCGFVQLPEDRAKNSAGCKGGKAHSWPEPVKKGDVLPFKKPAQTAKPAAPLKVPAGWDAAVKETAAAGPQAAGNVTSLAPKLEARKQLARTKVMGVMEDAANLMAQDPGFQAAARQRDAQGKEAKLKAGGQLYQPGQKVVHVDQQSIPWVGTVKSAAYRDNDIDGPGHYYEVGWHNPQQNQVHEDYLHQDFLRPHQ